MKKVMILAAAAALVLASCTKTQITDTITKVSDNQAIAFASYTSRSITKADASYYVDGTTVTNLVSNSTFGVYAWDITNTSTTPWTDGNLFDGTGTPAFMSNIPVTFKGAAAGSDGSANLSATGLYSAGNPVRYWPSGDTPAGLSFFAYYPANAAGLSLPTNGLGATTFQVRSTAAAQIDYMVANVVADQYYGHTNSSYSSGTKGTVDFTFHHTLTKVQFKFLTDNTDANTTVTLKGADLKGIYDTNVLTTSYTPGATPNAGTTTYTWNSSATNAANFAITISGSAITSQVLTNTATTPTAADAFLMVPQTIAAGQQKITLTWDVTTAGHTVTNTKTIDLNDIMTTAATPAHIDWGKNQQITYTITIGPKPIYFTASVAAWETPEINGAIDVN